MIINGMQGDLVHADDRGLMYGDGVFRTMLVSNGRVLHWQRHYDKLKHNCDVLAIACPSNKVLTDELGQLIQSHPDCVAKITITRGSGLRGYAPPAHSNVTRILDFSPIPNYPILYFKDGINVHICQLKLGHQQRLAGIKHLNRLENVLAAAECSAPNIAEGLLMDEAGFVIEATRSNLFLVKNEELYTPDLSRCGVAGVQRDRVIDWARLQGRVCHITDIQMSSLLAADEVFLVNSVIGLWPIREMSGFKRSHFPVSLQIQDWLAHETD